MAGYLLGTFPTAALVGRLTGHDPTAEGSGNPGATNVYGTSGRGAGAADPLIDLAKGVIAAGIGLAVGDHTLGVLTGAAAVLGHVVPLTRPTLGGKGVATAAGMAACRRASTASSSSPTRSATRPAAPACSTWR